MDAGKGSVILTLVLAFLVVFVLVQIKGGRDGCEASGGQPRGVECENQGGR